MSHIESLAVALISLGLYLFLFIDRYRHPDGIGRKCLLIVFGSLAAYFAIRSIGYAGLQIAWLSPLEVNSMFRCSGYLLTVPGVWLAAMGLRR